MKLSDNLFIWAVLVTIYLIVDLSSNPSGYENMVWWMKLLTTPMLVAFLYSFYIYPLIKIIEYVNEKKK